MLITCPNCQTRYEIDEKSLKDSQGALQCSHCGNIWSVPLIKPLILKPVEPNADFLEPKPKAAGRFAIYPVEDGQSAIAENGAVDSHGEQSETTKGAEIPLTPSEGEANEDLHNLSGSEAAGADSPDDEKGMPQPKATELSEDERIALALSEASRFEPAAFEGAAFVDNEAKPEAENALPQNNETIPDFEFVSATIDRLSEKARKEKGMEILPPEDDEAAMAELSEEAIKIGPADNSHLDDLLSKSHIISFIPPLGAHHSANLEAQEPPNSPKNADSIEPIRAESAISDKSEEIGKEPKPEADDTQSEEFSENSHDAVESSRENLTIVRNPEDEKAKQSKNTRNIDKAYAKRIERAVSKSIVYAPSFDKNPGQSTKNKPQSSKKQKHNHSDEAQATQSLFQMSNVVGFAFFMLIFLGLAGYYADWIVNLAPSLEPYVSPFQQLIQQSR